jgi:predicted dehydrogenase
LVTTNHRALLDDDRVEVLYIAVPHHLHEELYLAAIEAGRDFLGEKPFGIDRLPESGSSRRLLAALRRLLAALRRRPDLFVRCSSEMPYFPGAQAAHRMISTGALGRLIEASSAFLQSSDLDLRKPVKLETSGGVLRPHQRAGRPGHARPSSPVQARLVPLAGVRGSPRPGAGARPTRRVPGAV